MIILSFILSVLTSPAVTENTIGLPLWRQMRKRGGSKFVEAPMRHYPGEKNQDGYRGYRMEPGWFLKPGQYLMSDNCECVLTLQEDGDLVIWQPRVEHEMFHMAWRTGTQSPNVDRLVFEETGDLVVYNDDDTVLWAASEQANYQPAPFLNSTLAILDHHCIFAFYGGDGGHQFWTTEGQMNTAKFYGQFHVEGTEFVTWQHGMCTWFEKGDFSVNSVTCEVGSHECDGPPVDCVKTVECPVTVDECRVMCDDCEENMEEFQVTWKNSHRWDEFIPTIDRPSSTVKVKKTDFKGWSGNPYLTCGTRAILCHVGMSHNVNEQRVVCMKPVTKCTPYQECCGDEFDIEILGDNVIVRRTDVEGAGWWQDLELLCEVDSMYDDELWMQEDTEYQCHVGPSSKPHKEVECKLPLEGSSCKVVPKFKPKSGYFYDDEFTFESSHRTVAVQRTDANVGWSWDLYISCNLNKEVAMLDYVPRCRIGSSFDNKVTKDCGFKLDASCELVDVCCGDRFDVTFKGSEVTVRRTDNPYYGWGQHLTLACGMPTPTWRPSPMPTVFKPTEEGIKTDFPTFLPTLLPSGVPTQMPSITPSMMPSVTPSLYPTALPVYDDDYSWMYGGQDVKTFKGFKNYCMGMDTDRKKCGYCDGRKLKKCTAIGCSKSKDKKKTACSAPKKSTKVKCKKIKDPILCALIGCDALGKKCSGKPTF